MRFTMAQPGGLLPSRDAAAGCAHGRLGRALLLRARAAVRAGRGAPAALHLARRLRRAARDARRARPAPRRRLPRARRREPARRPRGRRPRGHRLLRQEHDADHAPARLLGRARHARHRRRDRAERRRSTLDCGECRLCIDACPTDALDEPGTLDATRCLSYWTQAPAADPGGRTASRSATMVYGCDICQDVCPWNRGIEKRRAASAEPGEAGRLARRLAVAPTTARRPLRPPVRPAQRPALPAPERARRAREHRGRAASSRRPYAEGDDPLLREHAEWALARLEGSAVVSYDQRVQAERWLAWIRLGAVPFAVFQAAASAAVPARRRALDLG